MNIEFSGCHAWDPNKDSMAFQVTVNGNNARCLITNEALQDHFNAGQVVSTQDAFVNNQSQIEDIARKIILRGQVNQDGDYIIYTRDI